MNNVIKRIMSIVCGVGFSFAILPIQNLANKSTYYIQANAEYDLSAEYPGILCGALRS